MTLRLPRGDTPVIGPNGAFNREWFKSLLANTTATNGILAGTTIYADTGTVNHMAISSGLKAYSRGVTRYLSPAFTNTLTALYLNDSGLGERDVVFPDGTLPAVGQILVGVTLEVIYNGTKWEVQTLQPSNQSIPGNLQVAGTLQVTGATTLTGGVTGAMAATGAVSGLTVSATNSVTAGTYVRMQVLAVGSLPSAVGIAGARYIVNNANATTFNSIVAAGGANNVPVFSDGTNWRIG